MNRQHVLAALLVLTVGIPAAAGANHNESGRQLRVDEICFGGDCAGLLAGCDGIIHPETRASIQVTLLDASGAPMPFAKLLASPYGDIHYTGSNGHARISLAPLSDGGKVFIHDTASGATVSLPIKWSALRIELVSVSGATSHDGSASLVYRVTAMADGVGVSGVTLLLASSDGQSFSAPTDAQGFARVAVDSAQASRLKVRVADADACGLPIAEAPAETTLTWPPHTEPAAPSPDPVVAPSLSVASTANWTRLLPAISLSAHAATYNWRILNGSWQPAPLTLSDGEATLEFRAVASNGRVGESKTILVRLDTAPPTIRRLDEPSPRCGSIRWSVEDPLSGTDAGSPRLSINGQERPVTLSDGMLVGSILPGLASLTVLDGAGNRAIVNENISCDVLELSVNADVLDTWQRCTAVRVAVTPPDASLLVTRDGQKVALASETGGVHQAHLPDGEQTLRANVAHGNQSLLTTFTIRCDSTPPALTVSSVVATAGEEVEVQAEDAHSGVASIRIRLAPGEPFLATSRFVVTESMAGVDVELRDAAGNVAVGRITVGTESVLLLDGDARPGALGDKATKEAKPQGPAPVASIDDAKVPATPLVAFLALLALLALAVRRPPRKS